MGVDAKLFCQRVDRIQGEIAFASLDASQIPRRHLQLFSQRFLGQPPGMPYCANLRTERKPKGKSHQIRLSMRIDHFQVLMTSSRIVHETNRSILEMSCSMSIS